MKRKYYKTKTWNVTTETQAAVKRTLEIKSKNVKMKILYETKIINRNLQALKFCLNTFIYSVVFVLIADH